jgi:hypothetical protein
MTTVLLRDRILLFIVILQCLLWGGYSIGHETNLDRRIKPCCHSVLDSYFLQSPNDECGKSDGCIP